VANHASFVDGLVLVLAFPDPVVLVASTELARARVVGSFLRRLGCVFVERGDPGQGRASVDALTGLLAGGERVALFPEGSITRAPGLRPFRLGAFAAAARTGSPVVPVGISGTRDLLRPGSYLPRRGGIRVVFGQPIVPGSAGFTSQVELRDAAWAAVARLSGESDLAPPPPAREGPAPRAGDA
jgi:1-acyl-sn-glycerol-3-phosphate acyltransferase